MAITIQPSDYKPPRNRIGRFLDGFGGHRGYVLAGVFMAASFALLLTMILLGRVDSAGDYALGIGAVASGVTAILSLPALADGKRTKMETANGPHPIYGEEPEATDPASGENE